MKYIKLYENFEDREKSIDDYPVSVKYIYRKFNDNAKKSINDNLEIFAKLAKRTFYGTKNWKFYFRSKDVKNLNKFDEIQKSLENWIKDK